MMNKTIRLIGIFGALILLVILIKLKLANKDCTAFMLAFSAYLTILGM